MSEGNGVLAPGSLDEIIQSREIVICCGPGGVGKTTLSASLALRAAVLGKKAVVCTIDPARRLANSLGLSELGNEEVEISRDRLAAAGISLRGSLSALMLDTKRQFDALIEKFAKNEDTRRRVLDNHFYQTISSNVAGSQEYMAMEKLWELHTQKRYDLIVLDTPPTKHALDFLSAPQRMTDVLDRSVFEMLMRPFDLAGKLTLGLVARAAKRITRRFDETVGIQFLHDLAEFFSAFETLYDGFRERAQHVNALLRERVTSFVVVASPLAIPLREARFFCDKLRELDLPLAALVLNRVHPSALAAVPADARAAVERAIARGVPAEGASPLVARLVEALAAQEHLARADRARVDELVRGPARGVLVREVPRFGGDVYDLVGLRRMNEFLFGEAGGQA